MAEPNSSDQDLTMPPTGDASAALAVLDAWQRARPPARLDWDGVFGQMREALIQLTSFPMVAGDEAAQAILRKMVLAEDMEELAAIIDELGIRVGEMLAAKRRRSGRRALFEVMESKPERGNDNLVDEGRDRRDGRMVLRL